MHEDRREGTIERKTEKKVLVLLAIDILIFIFLDNFSNY